MVRGGSSPLGRTGKAPEIEHFRGCSVGDLEKNAKPVCQDFGKSRQAGSAARARRPTWLDANIPACTRIPRPAAAPSTAPLYTDASGRQRQKRGFTSPSAAAKFRARMQVRAERGELRITRETFAEHFDGWLKGHHRASKATRDGVPRGRRAPAEAVLRPHAPVGDRRPDRPQLRRGDGGAGRGRRARPPYGGAVVKGVAFMVPFLQG